MDINVWYILIFSFLECCAVVSIRFNENEFSRPLESPLVGAYKMTGVNANNHYMYIQTDGGFNIHKEYYQWKASMNNAIVGSTVAFYIKTS